MKYASFIISNEGYTVERFIHGPQKSYNDIQGWNYRDLPAVFGARPGTYQSHSVRTTGHLERLLSLKSFNDAHVLQVCLLHDKQTCAEWLTWGDCGIAYVAFRCAIGSDQCC